jgi:multiple sugar transport system ATP-binding protein
MATVAFRKATKSFGPVSIIKGVDLDIADGEFCVFVGPSGCGKSTLLRMIAGLEDFTAGDLRIGGTDMTHIEPANRGVAMVFQSYALYPHMTVRENIGFGLRMTGHDRGDIEVRIKRASDMLQLGPLLERKPAQLSGGQRQRVAIGRAIVRNPEVFLFDEPLSNLDAALRVQMRLEISRLHQELKATMIYVTHDQVEAMTMADRIVVLNGGLIEQIGTPLELYHRPRNIFVAGFIGSPKMNFLKATVAPGTGAGTTVSVAGATRIALPVSSSIAAGGQALTLGVRPEHLTVGGRDGARARAQVRLIEQLGSETMIYATLADGSELAVKADGLFRVEPGVEIEIGLPPAACHLFDAEGRTILNGDLTR